MAKKEPKFQRDYTLYVNDYPVFTHDKKEALETVLRKAASDRLNAGESYPDLKVVERTIEDVKDESSIEFETIRMEGTN